MFGILKSRDGWFLCSFDGHFQGKREDWEDSEGKMRSEAAVFDVVRGFDLQGLKS